MTNVKIFAETLENEARDQIAKIATSKDYRDSIIRIMPDAHAGNGCTIGTTITISDRVTPNLVGVDIGCGMLTVCLSDTEIDFRKLDGVIREFVPSGFDVHSSPKVKVNFSALRCSGHVDTSWADRSLGTLGGGNHFIEVGRSSRDNRYYLVIHTGSRKLGKDVCTFYQGAAASSVEEYSRTIRGTIERMKDEGRKNDISAELKKLKENRPDKDLACVVGDAFSDYLNDMQFVQAFASLNRSTIAQIILEKMGFSELDRFETVHNYIDFDRMILRKGAVRAEKGERLLIPLNMRDGSLLCTGKGNPDWNYSAPHGAGRLMSRGKAKNSLSMDEYRASMKEVFTTSVSLATIDEAPQVYKPMAEIVRLIQDTVDIEEVIKPVYNFKAS